MIISVLLVFFDLFVNVFDVIIIIRIVLSWIVPDLHNNMFGRLTIELTEPILGPIRKLLPQGGMIDWAPLVAVFGLYLVRQVVFNLIIR
ncbi:MAG: YggT family protein [Candidatus Saccharimonadia bacterium]